MTSEPSAEPTMSTPGPSAFLTVGNENLIGTELTDTGLHGLLPDLGFLEHNLLPILAQSGMPEESIQDISQEIIRGARLMLRGVLVSFISDTLTVLTELQKPKSTSTSESQNEEMG